MEQHSRAFFIPQEGQVDAQRFMKATSDYLLSHPSVTWHQEIKVEEVKEGQICFAGVCETYDWVFDVRGLGAQDDMSDLRGVRGEVFLVRCT